MCRNGDCLSAACANAATIRVGDVLNGQLVAGTADFALACDPANVVPAPDRAFRFTLAAPARIRFTVAGVAAFVYITSGCDGAAPVEACGAALGAVNLPAGDHTVVVEGVGGAVGNFTIRMESL